MKYEIKNWSQFQQYKDDRPLHWIKLHNSILDDFSFNQLSESLQLQLLKLWLVASKNGGKFEGDDKWLAQLAKLKKVDINQLITSGFIIRTDLYENIQEIPIEEKSREDNSREDSKPIIKKGKNIPPSIDDIKSYLLEKNITSFSAEKFHSHYSAANWYRGKTKIKDWIACVTTWQQNNKDQPKSKHSGFKDRDYSEGATKTEDLSWMQ